MGCRMSNQMPKHKCEYSIFFFQKRQLWTIWTIFRNKIFKTFINLTLQIFYFFYL